MEFLTVCLDVEYLKGNLSPIYNIDSIITHLLYVDDILIMAKATKKNAECILHTFQLLKSPTGLSLNEDKSTLFFSKGANNKSRLLTSKT